MKRKRTTLDLIMLGTVILVAGVVIALSFTNTAKLANVLNLHPYLAAGLVEILFALLLFTRGRQRALQRNVPTFLEIGYFIALGFVTVVNMWGLAQEHLVIGLIVGLAVSGAMWLMETTLVWLYTRSHEPHRQTAKDMMKKAKREIEEEKAVQQILYMKWEAEKPDLKLIEQARKAEEKRAEIVGDGLPKYFLQEQKTPAYIPTFELTFEPTQNMDEALKHQRLEHMNDHPQTDANLAESEPRTTNNLPAKPAKPKAKKTGNRTRQIKKAYERFVQEHGKKPGRVVLAREAKVSEHEARAFLENLKEEEAKMQQPLQLVKQA